MPISAGTVKTTTFSDEVLTGHRPVQLAGVAAAPAGALAWRGPQRRLLPDLVRELPRHGQPGASLPQTSAPTVSRRRRTRCCRTAAASKSAGCTTSCPSKFGQVDNLVTLSEHFGGQTEVFNGVDITMSARLGRRSLRAGRRGDRRNRHRHLCHERQAGRSGTGLVRRRHLGRRSTAASAHRGGPRAPSSRRRWSTRFGGTCRRAPTSGCCRAFPLHR